MNFINEEAKLTLWTYWQKGIDSPAVWALPLIVAGSIVLLVLLISLALPKRTNTATYRSLVALYYAGISVIVLSFAAILCVMKFTSMLSSGSYQLGMVLGLLVAYTFTFVVYYKLCAKGAKADTLLLGMPLTPKAKTDAVNAFRRAVARMCLWSVAVGLPFLLLLINISRSYLVSVVFDNSGSMESYNYFQDSRLAFSNVVANTTSNNDYVLTYFTTDGKFTPSYDEIVATTKPNELKTITNHYPSHFDFLGDLSTIQSGGGSPIMEGIWQNYLVCRSQLDKYYDAKKLIVITDGEDNLYWSMNPKNAKDPFFLAGSLDRLKRDIFQQKDEKGETISEFFGSEVYVITWAPENEGKYLLADCAGSITQLDGSDTQSYYRSLREAVLPEMYFDKLLLYILIGFACLLPLVLYLIKTCKI